ncbi:hypothetical protein GCM10020331_056890 [Ectobacillus funiculus]
MAEDLLQGTMVCFGLLLVSFYTSFISTHVPRLQKNKKTHLLCIFFLYVISHIEGWHVNTLSGSEPSLHMYVPWNLDVSLLALCYYSIGYYTKTYLKRIPALLTGICILLTVGCIALQELGLLDYHLSMKYLNYDYYALDLLIPFYYDNFILWNIPTDYLCKSSVSPFLY